MTYYYFSLKVYYLGINKEQGLTMNNEYYRDEVLNVLLKHSKGRTAWFRGEKIDREYYLNNINTLELKDLPLKTKRRRTPFQTCLEIISESLDIRLLDDKSRYIPEATVYGSASVTIGDTISVATLIHYIVTVKANINLDHEEEYVTGCYVNDQIVLNLNSEKHILLLDSIKTSVHVPGRSGEKDKWKKMKSDISRPLYMSNSNYVSEVKCTLQLHGPGVHNVKFTGKYRDGKGYGNVEAWLLIYVRRR